MTDQREDATYDAYLLRYPDGSWLAQLADLPGGYATGASQEQATTRLTAAIPAYYAWLSQHDEYTPTIHSTPHVTTREVAEVGEGPGHGLGAFFAGDSQPVSDEDLDWWLAALGWAYDDLAAQAQRSSDDAKYLLLGAVARLQLDLVGYATGAQPPAPASEPSVQALVPTARSATLAAFRATSAEQRAAVREVDGQRWSVRRGLRESALLVRRATDQLAAQG